MDAAVRDAALRHGPGVTAVAARLGGSHAVLLQRAGSKQRLMQGALQPRVPESAARRPSTNRRQGLLRVLSEWLGFHSQLPPGLMALEAGGFSPASKKSAGPPPPVRLRRARVGWLVRCAVARRRSVALAEGLLGALEARCFNAHLGGAAFIEGSDGRFLREPVTGLVPEL